MSLDINLSRLFVYCEDMITEKVGEHEVRFYSSVEELPIRRYQRFNKFLMIDNEVGCDFADFNKRSTKTIQLLRNKMYSEAITELENRRMMVYNAYMDYSPKSRALAILVYSIDGEVFEGFTSDVLDDILDKLDKIGYTKSQAVKTTEEVKKN